MEEPKVLAGSHQNGTRDGMQCRSYCIADKLSSADRRCLTQVVHPAERGKPVVFRAIGQQTVKFAYDTAGIGCRKKAKAVL